MKDNSGLVFDEVKYLVSKDEHSVTLNPLSFKLLHTLAQTPHQVVSVKTLLAKVWPNNTVSPDTLKQRVFVLRKSLEQSSIEGVSIQAVRGEGYRLITEQAVISNEPAVVTEQTKKVHSKKTFNANHKQYFVLLTALLILIALIVYFVQPPNNEKAASNNRIALWSNISPNEMPEQAISIYQSWNSLLKQANDAQHLQLILSSQRRDIALPVQARKDRIALISYFDVINVNNETIVKLSIIEPTTATILRTNILSSDESTSVNSILQSQLAGIQALVSSGKLYLNKQQREYAKDPIWPKLKALANPS